MTNKIYEKSLAVFRSAMDTGRGLEMAENHLFAAIGSLTRSEEIELRDELKAKLCILQGKLHQQIVEDNE
jgi:hypothetical protein